MRLQVPSGLQTRRGYAPADIARSAAESAAPWAWRGALLAPLFYAPVAYWGGGSIRTSLLTAPRSITRAGRGWGSSAIQSAERVRFAVPWQRSGITELTFIACYVPAFNSDFRVNETSGAPGRALAGNAENNNTGIRAFNFLNADPADIARWRIPESANVDIDISTGPLHRAGEIMHFAGRLGGGLQEFSICNLTTGEVRSNSVASNAAITFDTEDFDLGNSLGVNNSTEGSVVYALLQFRRWTDAEIAYNREDPFAPFRRRPLLVPVSGGGSVSLSIASATHAHTAATPTLTEAAQLAVDDTLHAHAADSPALTQAHVLTVASADHAHSAEAVALVQAHTLAVADALHGHTADALDLGAGAVLSVADALHAQSADAVTLSMAGILAVQSAEHAQTAESPALVQSYVLTPQGATHGQSAEAVTLTQQGLLAIQSALHEHLAGEPDLLESAVLVVSDTLHAHLADDVIFEGTVFRAGRLLVVRGHDRLMVVAPSDRLLIVKH